MKILTQVVFWANEQLIKIFQELLAWTLKIRKLFYEAQTARIGRDIAQAQLTQLKQAESAKAIRSRILASIVAGGGHADIEKLHKETGVTFEFLCELQAAGDIVIAGNAAWERNWHNQVTRPRGIRA